MIVLAGQSAERHCILGKPGRVIHENRADVSALAWQNAVCELCRVTRECLELAWVQGDPSIIEIAETAAARVRT